MDEKPYLNREIDEFMRDMRESNQRIETGVSYTNGKVGEINIWRERVNGALLASGAFMTLIVMPILGWAIYVLVNIDSSINASVQQSLSAYNITTHGK